MMEFVCSFGVLLVAFAAGAADPTWIGGSGNWSDAKNWKDGTLPVETDIVRVSNTVANITINIDLESVKVKEMHFEGHTAEGTVTVTGGKLFLTSSAYNMVAVTDAQGKISDYNTRHYDRSYAAIIAYPYGVDFYVPVEFTSTGTAGLMGTYGDMHFRKSVTAPNATKFIVHNGIHKDQFGYVKDKDSNLFFHDSVVMPKANVTPQQSPTGGFFTFGPTFEVKSLALSDYISPTFRLMSTNTVIHAGTVTPLYGSMFQSEKAGTYPTNTVVEFRVGGSTCSGEYQATLDLGLVDRTFDRLSSVSPLNADAKNGYSIRSRANSPYVSSLYCGAPTTLTLRGTASAVTEGMISDEITVIWDPAGDYTQTFTNRTHKTTGSFIVKRGTMKLVGTGTFAAARSLEIASGATFELNSSQSDPLPRDLVVTSTSKLKLNGASVTVKRLVVDGDAQTNGTYTGEAWLDGAGSITVAAGSCCTWTNTAGGVWSDAANWLDGKVPTSTSSIAILDAETASDITITVDSAIEAANFPGKLEILNRGAGTTTLSIASSVTNNSGLVRVGRHARVSVPEGGLFYYETAAKDRPSSQYNSSWHWTHVLAIVDGGQWLTCGGEVVYTNVCGECWVNGEGSKLVVSAGKHTYTDWDSSYPLTIGAGGRLELTGGTLYQPHEGYNQNADLLLFGGTADFSGGTYNANASCIGPGSAGTAGHSSGVDLGHGTFIMRGTTKVNLPGTLHFRTVVSGTHLDWSICDNAQLYDRSYMIGGRRYGDATVRICGKSPYSNRSSACGQWYLGTFSKNVTTGSDAGDGRLIVTSGSALYAGYEGVFVAGGQRSYTGETLYQNGYLRVEPTGLLDVYGSTVSAYCEKRPTGLAVGMAAMTGIKSGHPCEGRAEIAGEVTNRLNLVVGGWYARGTYVQEGGHTVTATGTGVDRGVTAFGFGGGEGKLLVSNGCFTAKQSVWIGGCLTNDFVILKNGQPSANLYAATGGWPVDNHGATGLLELSGGQFAAAKDLYVGADGTGVVSVVGSTGAFSVGQNLVLSNQTASILRFTADEKGVAPVEIGGKLVLTDASALEVDLSACPNLHHAKLFTVTGGVEGDFGKTTIVPSTFQLVRRGNGYYAKTTTRRGVVIGIQ